MRTLFIRHARATSFSSACTKSKTQQSIELKTFCVNLVCEYFCWMLGDPHFFFGRSLPFVILSITLKSKKYLYVGSFNYFSYTIQKGSNWYMDRGLAPVVRKPISANPRLNRLNPQNKFVLRLNSVPRSSISTIQVLN